jgi:hypothetical protein
VYFNTCHHYWDTYWPEQDVHPFTPHDIDLLTAFMRGIGMEPNVFIQGYFGSLRRLGSEETVPAVMKFNSESSPVSAALIVARLLTCSSSKPLDITLSVFEDVCGMDEFWDILKHLRHSEQAGGLRHVRELSYEGLQMTGARKRQSDAVDIGGLDTSGSRWGLADQQQSYSHWKQFQLLFGVPIESISLDSTWFHRRNLLYHQFHPGIQSTLTSLTLSCCGTASLVSILPICPYLTTLNYTGVIPDFTPFDAESLGIALGHAPSLEHVTICFWFMWSARLGRPEACWLRGTIGTLKNLVRLQTLEIPTQLLLGWGLDTPRKPLWDVLPDSLHKLKLRDDGAEIFTAQHHDYCWAKTLAPLFEYLEWREHSCMDQICICQRFSRLDSAVMFLLQQKCHRLGIKLGFE